MMSIKQRLLKICLSYTSRNTLDFEAIYSESSVSKPVVITYTEESETIRRMFAYFAKSRVNNAYTIIDVNSLGIPEEKQLKTLFTKPMEDGTWLLLHNCHNSIALCVVQSFFLRLLVVM